MKTPSLFLMLSLSFATLVAGQSPPPTEPALLPAVTPEPAATPSPPPAASPQRSAADLEKLTAPIALYPDPLIAIILPASVYPVEIVQAARFVADSNNVVRIDEQPWDENVRAVAKFAPVIQKMSDDLTWTVELGKAFLDQPMDLMNSIQDLRAKAQAAGNLTNTPQQVVTVTNEIVERTFESQIVYVTNTVIQVQPASTEIVYVPSYNPTVVYVDDDDDDVAVVFGVGVVFGAAMWGHCDYHYGGCYHGYYPPPPPPYPPPYRPPGGRPPGTRPPPGSGNRPPGMRPPGSGVRPPTAGNMPGQPGGGPAASQRWQPDKSRMGTGGSPSVANSARNMEARGWNSGGAKPTTGNVATRPSTTMPSASRPSATMPAAANRPATTMPAGSRPTATVPSASQPTAYNANRPSPSPSVSQSRPDPSQGSAFSGTANGASAYNSSNRGSTSRGGGGGSRGGGRSGGGRGGGGRGGGRR